MYLCVDTISLLTLIALLSILLIYTVTVHTVSYYVCVNTNDNLTPSKFTVSFFCVCVDNNYSIFSYGIYIITHYYTIDTHNFHISEHEYRWKTLFNIVLYHMDHHFMTLTEIK